MMKHYKEIRKDALILIDVAGESESSVLDEKILLYLYGNGDSSLRLLRLFSKLPIMSVNAFYRGVQEVKKDNPNIERVVFQDLHINNDIMKSSFYNGHVNHPCLFSVRDLNRPDSKIADLSNEYQSFRGYVLKNLGVNNLEGYMKKEKKLSMTLVERNGNTRVLLNPEIIINAANERNVQATTIDLSVTDTTEQISLLATTDILVAVGGSAVHNVLFLPKGSAAIVLMPTGWCSWSWMFANQAVLLGIHVQIYCDEDDVIYRQYSQRTYHWTRNVWTQGPQLTKGRNITVNVKEFENHLDFAIKALRGNFTDQNKMKNMPHTLPLCEKYMESDRKMNVQSSLPSLLPLSVEKMRLFISSIYVKEKLYQDTRQIAIQGQLYFPSSEENQMGQMRSIGSLETRSILSSLPYLSVCVTSLHFRAKPWCYPIENFNYHSDLLITLPATEHVLCFWIQTSAYGGRVRNTDTYLFLDLQTDDLGFDVHTFEHIQNFSRKVTIDDGRLSFTFEYSYKGPHSLQEAFTELAIATYGDSRTSELSFPSTMTTIVTHITCALLEIRLKHEPFAQIQRLPSPENPFFFLHIEKTAGTTLRELIVNASIALQLQYAVPCYDPLHCETFDLSNTWETSDRNKMISIEHEINLDLRNVSVVGGHFSWGEWKKLPTLSNYGEMPSCFIMVREPVDRIISFYYQRIYNSTGKHMRNFTADELNKVLVSSFGGVRKLINGELKAYLFDEGMSNDPVCRAILGAKETTGSFIDTDIEKNRTPLEQPISLIRAKRNANKCIIGSQEHMEETKLVLSHWFPWLDTVNRWPSKKFQEGVAGKDSRRDLPENLVRAIEEANPCDVALYQHMMKRFQKELKHVMNPHVTIA